MGVEGTGGLSAGRSLALGPSVWADRKEQLPCRAGQGAGGGWKRKEEAALVFTGIGRYQAVSACVHTHTYTL